MNKETFFEILSNSINNKQFLACNIMEDSPMRFIRTSEETGIDELFGFDNYLTIFEELKSWVSSNNCDYEISPFHCFSGPSGIMMIISKDGEPLILISMYNQQLWEKYHKQ